MLNEVVLFSLLFTAISDASGMCIRDIVSTLLDLGLLKYIRTEYYIVDEKVCRFILSLTSLFDVCFQ